MFPKEDKAHKSCVFYFNKCFVNAGLIVDTEGDLASLKNQIKMKEKESMEEFNPWNKDVKSLERVLDSHDSIMKEGKDDREATNIGVTTKVSIRVNIEVNIARITKQEE